MILALKTDQPEAELYLLSGNETIASYSWYAHRQLSNTILEKIEMLLKDNKQKLTSLRGIVVYQGPGSFTGLRIGVTTANTLAYSLKIPITGAVSQSWKKNGLQSLDATKEFQYVLPLYGSEPTITKPRK
jgi:tRNA threonylcarbamoyladenosine biosynthesis protein TsaB